MKNKLVVLLSDFGTKDSYVSVMKGVMKTVSSEIEFIDLTHEIEKQNIQKGAWVLRDSFRYFPKETVFLCVVDPGVGSKRLPIAVRTENYYFVGPDNGLISLAAKQDKVQAVRVISGKSFWKDKRISNTFHGRDVFAPAAASIASAKQNFSKLGPLRRSFEQLKVVKPVCEEKRVFGEIMYFDDFGNAVTNISLDYLKKKSVIDYVQVGSQKIKNIVDCYAQGGKTAAALINSFGYLEIAWPQGSAKKEMKLRLGQKVKLRTNV